MDVFVAHAALARLIADGLVLNVHGQPPGEHIGDLVEIVAVEAPVELAVLLIGRAQTERALLRKFHVHRAGRLQIHRLVQQQKGDLDVEKLIVHALPVDKNQVRILQIRGFVHSGKRSRFKIYLCISLSASDIVDPFHPVYNTITKCTRTGFDLKGERRTYQWKRENT